MKWTAMGLVFIFSFNALALDQGSLLVCRAVLDTVKSDKGSYFNDSSRRALLDALTKYDTKVGMFLRENPQGEIEFDPQYANLRAEQINLYYGAAKTKANEYKNRAGTKEQLLKEKESLTSDLEAARTKYRELLELTTEQDNDSKIREIKNLQEKEFQYENRSSWGKLSKKEVRDRAEAKEKYAAMLANPETSALWASHQDTRAKRNEAQLAVRKLEDALTQNGQLVSGVEYYKPNLIEDAVVLSEPQTSVLDSVIDLAQKTNIPYKSKTESEKFIASVQWVIDDMAKSKPAMISFLLAELEAGHGKEIRLLKNSMEAKAIEERDKKIASLEQRLANLESQGRSNASDITSVKNDIKSESSDLKKQIESLSTSVKTKFGFWGVVIVSVIVHHFL